MRIEDITTNELAEVVAGLVKQGLTFRAFPTSGGRWTIELLGGY